jgi:hypothetical protein
MGSPCGEGQPLAGKSTAFNGENTWMKRLDTMFGDGSLVARKNVGSVPSLRLIPEEKRHRSKAPGYSPPVALLDRLEFPNIFVLETK